MAEVLSKGTLFPEQLIPDLIQKTTGSSALATLTASRPIPFNGMKEFTFQLDKEVDIVAENGAKSKGGATVEAITIVPIKLEYGARVSNEFDYASEEVKLDYMTAFMDGFARKVAKGLDLMAIHGVNPRTGSTSEVIGNNCFDKKVTQKVTAEPDSKPDDNIESAIELIQAKDHDASGLILAPTFRAELAKQVTTAGAKLYPELAWGNTPGSLNGLAVRSTSNLSANSSKDLALVGDFANAFQWGYAKEIPMEIIRYGNPDNDPTLGDLKGHNQIYLRAEVYIGWAILDPNAFALIEEQGE